MRLSRQCGFLHFELRHFPQSHVRGDYAACIKDHEVAWHQFHRRYCLDRAVAHTTRLESGELFQCAQRLLRAIFLNESDDGV